MAGTLRLSSSALKTSIGKSAVKKATAQGKTVYVDGMLYGGAPSDNPTYKKIGGSGGSKTGRKTEIRYTDNQGAYEERENGNTNIIINPDANLKDIIQNQSFNKLDKEQQSGILKNTYDYQKQKAENKATYIGSTVMSADQNRQNQGKLILSNNNSKRVNDTSGMNYRNSNYTVPTSVPTMQAQESPGTFKQKINTVATNFTANTLTNLKTRGPVGIIIPMPNASGTRAVSEMADYGFGQLENVYLKDRGKESKGWDLPLGFAYATAGGVAFSTTILKNPTNVKEVPKGLIGYGTSLYGRTRTKPLGAVGEIGALVGTKGIKAGIEGLRYETFGKEIPAENLFSERGMRSTTGLDTTFNPSKTIYYAEKSRSQKVFNDIPEFKGKQIYVSGTDYPKFITEVKSKMDIGEPLAETGGQFASPLGKGQPRFTRVEPTGTGYTTKDLTLKQKSEQIINSLKNTKVEYNPFSNIKDILNTKKPQLYVISAEKTVSYPKRILELPKKESLKAIEELQKRRSGKGEAYITRESSLGIKREPEVTFGVKTKYNKVGKEIYYTKLNNKYVKLRPVETIRTPKFKDPFKINKTTRKKISAKDIIKSDKYLESSTRKGSSINLDKYLRQAYSRTSSIPRSSSYNLSSLTSRSSYPKSSSLSSRSLGYSSSSLAKSGSSVLSKSDSVISRSSSNRDTSSIISSDRNDYSEPRPIPSRSYGYIPRPITPPTPTITSRRFKGKKIEGSASSNGSTYRVQIKSGSNWVNIKDKTKRNLGSALEFGSSIVDNYKERSFRLKKSSGNPKDIKPIPFLNKFYQPSKRKNPKLTSAWIEKTPYLIDRRNEVIGISYKGIQAKRNKRK